MVVDCDNGFGGFSNVVRTAVEFDRAGVAAICIEDNLFPKRNSLYQGQSKRELIPTREQARRLKAAVEGKDSEAFVVIARVEALIAGHGVEAAWSGPRRTPTRVPTPILIHCKDKTLAEITDFLEAWHAAGMTKPLVAVPTLFPDYTADELHAKGFSMVILANQPMRAAVKAMEETLEVARQGAQAGRSGSAHRHGGPHLRAGADHGDDRRRRRRMRQA